MILISLETTEISCPFAKSSEFRGSLALRMKKAKDLTGFPNTSSFMHTLGRLYAAAILTPGVAERSIAGSIPTESTLFRRRSIHQHPSVRAVRLLPHRSRTGRARVLSLTAWSPTGHSPAPRQNSTDIVIEDESESYIYQLDTELNIPHYANV